jgi:hypothetical protein
MIATLSPETETSLSSSCFSYLPLADQVKVISQVCAGRSPANLRK